MRKTLSLLLAFFCAVGLVACGAPKPSPEVSSAPPSPSPTVESTPAPIPEPTVDASKLSVTTGMETGGNYQPIAVMIENSPAARPQTGLQQADIVYETMAESNITRFMAIFNDQTPVVAGPVRSARIYYINLQREWDPVFVHYGGPSSKGKPSYVYGPEADTIKVRLNGVKGNSVDYFWRDKSRKAPHNAYTNIQKIRDEKCDDYTASKRESFLFDASVVPQGEAVTKVQLPYLSSKSNFVEYRYDAEKDKFIRYMGGEPFVTRTVTSDGDDQKVITAPVEVQNLIVQYTNIYEFKNDTKGRRNVEVYGQGKAEFFVGGIHQTGAWERPKGTDLTKFYLDDGSEVVLKPGNTWIHLHPDSKDITIN